MRPVLSFFVTTLLFALCAVAVTAQVPERMVGTIVALAADRSSVDLKSDDGKQVSAHLTPDTVFKRVAPGEKSLKNAETIQAGDLAVGDRVLLNADPATASALRLVVMPATAIAKHDEADRAAWTTHGISGIVVAKTGDDLTLRQRGLQGDTQAHVIVSSATHFKKYADDSVRFTDAKTSSFEEVHVGDQLRARGEKSEDATKVTAAEVVFGTFVTKAGVVTAVDAEKKTVAIKELNTNLALLLNVTGDSQLKKMPDFTGMPGGRTPGGAPGGAPVSGGGGMPPMAGRAPDLSQMIEHMPPVSLDGIKVGDTVVMSSTKGKKDNEFTAIVLLDNAGMLIRMASAQGGSGQRSQQGQMPTGGQQGIGGMQGGLGNLELPGMMQ